MMGEPTEAPGGLFRRAARFMTKPRGDRRWDLLLRATGLVALIGIPIVLLFPQSTPLVWFGVAAVPANSPLSPITPVAFEPLIMEAAKHSPAIYVTLVGLAVYMYMEYLNFHLYAWVLDRKRLATLREHRLVKRGVGHFSRAPAVFTFVFALTPLPFWVARILAIYQGYSIRRFMIATAVGRFPRILFYAAIGAYLGLPAVLLAGIAVGATVLVVAVRLAKRQQVIHDEVLDAEIPESEPAANLEPQPQPQES